jgi:hypothetical protein
MLSQTQILKMMIRFLLYLFFFATASGAEDLPVPSISSAPSGAPSTSLFHDDRDIFDWDIQLIEGYPIASFTPESMNNEFEFGYEFEGTLGDESHFTVDLRQADCVSPADDIALAAFDYVEGNNIWVDVDLIQETIVSSVHYKQTNETFAQIDFCLRIDYNLVGDNGTFESVNFHETVTTVHLNLTAGFNVTDIIITKDSAYNTGSEAMQYPIMAYFCKNDNSNVSQGILEVGDDLQFCVKSLTDGVFVSDILSTGISQSGSANTVIISERKPDPQTANDCSNGGICNIKTRLPSRLFDFEDPPSLLIQGVAILALGIPSRRLIAVPIQILSPDRRLNSIESDFLLQAELQTSFESTESNGNNGVFVLLIFGVLIVTLSACLVSLAFGYAKRRRRRQELSASVVTDVIIKNGKGSAILATDPGDGSGSLSEESDNGSRLSESDNESEADESDMESVNEVWVDDDYYMYQPNP